MRYNADIALWDEQGLPYSSYGGHYSPGGFAMPTGFYLRKPAEQCKLMAEGDRLWAEGVLDSLREYLSPMGIGAILE